MPKRRLYSHPFFKKITDATVDYVDGETVPTGYILYVTTATIEDENTAPTTLSFGKKSGSSYTPLEEDDSPAVGIRYHTERTHHFIAGEKPSFRVEGATLNDVVRGYAEGYYEEI